MSKQATTVNQQMIEEALNITFGRALPIVSQYSTEYNSEDTANEARARNGWLALSTYASKVYGASANEPVDQGVRDLLGDLNHLCHNLGLDFEDLIERARGTYLEELMNPLG
jgi:hypothetical protein